MRERLAAAQSQGVALASPSQEQVAEVRANVRTFHGSSVCAHASGVAPYIVVRGRPRIGHPFRLTVLAEGLPGGGPDKRDIWVITSRTRLQEPVSFEDFGMPGCWAHLPISNVMFFPGGEHTKIRNWERRAGEGAVVLEWDIPRDDRFMGHTVYYQAVVHSPGANEANLAASHAVQIVVGR